MVRKTLHARLLDKHA